MQCIINVFFLIYAGFIEKNCWSSMEEYFNSLIKALAVECEESGAGAGGLKRKTRRRRRVTATGVTIQTRSPDRTAFHHQSPVVELPHTSTVNGNSESCFIRFLSMLIIILQIN